MSERPSDISALLDHERAVLLAGDYAALRDISPEKTRLLAAGDLSDCGAPPAAILRKLQRNQVLLAMAITGVRSARGQLDAIEQQRNGFESYDMFGTRSTVGGPTGLIERKV